MAETDVLIVSAEPSGDQLGAALISSLRNKAPELSIQAIGGTAIDATGLKSLMSVEGLAILGFAEGLKAYPFVLKKVREATDIILDQSPKAVVLIDSWGLMVRIAKALKAGGFQGQIIKYVAPQVWAMRSGRAKILARYVDHLLSTQPMDAPFFEAAKLPHTFVGNPVLDQDYTAGDTDRFFSETGLQRDRPIIGYFFGSRPSEIERVGPAIVKTQIALQAAIPNSQSVFVVAESVLDQVEDKIGQCQGDAWTVSQDQLIDAMSVMDVAVACSGTITTQLAAAGVPTVVLYKLSPLTYAVARRLFKPRFMSLVNISADQNAGGTSEGLLPEFIQDEIMTEAPAEAALKLLKTPSGLREALKQETRRMGAGSGSASEKAAEAILQLIA